MKSVYKILIGTLFVILLALTGCKKAVGWEQEGAQRNSYNEVFMSTVLHPESGDNIKLAFMCSEGGDLQVEARTDIKMSDNDSIQVSTEDGASGSYLFEYVRRDGRSYRTGVITEEAASDLTVALLILTSPALDHLSNKLTVRIRNRDLEQRVAEFDLTGMWGETYFLRKYCLGL